MSVKISIAWMTAAQAASFFAQFASSIIVARYLAPHDLGIYAIALATVAILSVVQSFGFSPLLVREPTLTNALKDSAFTANTAVAVILSGVVLASSFIAPQLYDEKSLGFVLRTLSVIPLIGIPSFLPAALLEREARFKAVALAGAASSVASAVIASTLVVFNFGVISLAYANVVGTTVLTLFLCLYGREFLRLRFQIIEWRRVLGFGSQIFVASGLVNLSPRIGEIVLGKALGLSALGLYTRANNLCNLIWVGLHPIIARVVLVDFARVYRSEGNLRERYIATVTIVTGLLWPAFIGLAVISKPLIIFIYGVKWVGVAPVLTLLSVASAILVMSTVAWEVCTVTGNVGVQIRIESIRLIVSLGLLICGALISLEAVAFSRVIEAIVTFFLYRRQLGRLTQTRLIDFAGAYIKGAVLAFGAAMPAVVIFHSVGGAPNQGIYILLAITSGALAWCALLPVTRHPLAGEISAIARKVMGLITVRIH